MFPIYSAAQIRAWDAYTIAREPVASVDLMFRAAKAFVDWLIDAVIPCHETPIEIFCGQGNNGGDGYAAALILNDLGYHVRVLSFQLGDRISPDALFYLERVAQRPQLELLSYPIALDLPPFDEDAIIVDALFGTGVNRPIENDYRTVFEQINRLPQTVVSIDMPSGMLADQPTPAGACVEADYTFSFQIPKLALLLPENAYRTGRVYFGNIGLHPDFCASENTDFHQITLDWARQTRIRRNRFDHKGIFGHALLIAGSKSKMGAAVLAAQACLRSGVGLTTVHAPASGEQTLQIAVPEAMFSRDENDASWSRVPADMSRYQAVGIGPGLGEDDLSRRALNELFESPPDRLVLDADALNLMAKDHASERHNWPSGAVMTPHPKEFERLFGPTEDHFKRLDLLREKAAQHRMTIVLKGANTAIASPAGRIYFNPTGNPGMATGGSGDVLTGLITGLMAQGYTPDDAACLGVWLHGRAGDLAAAEGSEEALIAGDLIRYLGKAWLELA